MHHDRARGLMHHDGGRLVLHCGTGGGDRSSISIVVGSFGRGSLSRALTTEKANELHILEYIFILAKLTISAPQY